MLPTRKQKGAEAMMLNLYSVCRTDHVTFHMGEPMVLRS